MRTRTAQSRARAHESTRARARTGPALRFGSDALTGDRGRGRQSNDRRGQGQRHGLKQIELLTDPLGLPNDH